MFLLFDFLIVAELSSIELNKNTRLSEIEQDYLYNLTLKMHHKLLFFLFSAYHKHHYIPVLALHTFLIILEINLLELLVV